MSCSVPEEQIVFGGVGRNGIPALSNPRTVPPGDDELAYLDDDNRVVGIQLAGRTVAVPTNILWWHEIVNFDVGGRSVAVTYCPLTGSSLAFERDVVDGDDFIVSGLLYFTNLIMTSRGEGESLFAQMSRRAICGPATGTSLDPLPVTDVAYRTWRRLHPETEVLSSRTGFDRDYTQYPYGNYTARDNENTLFPVPRIDPRRPPKERVLGVPAGEGGLAFPFLELNDGTEATVAEEQVGGEPLVVFWTTSGRGARAFHPETVGGSSDGTLRFEDRDGRFVDVRTGSEWSLDGRAVSGPMEGARLQPVEEAYVAFWFAWALFQPETGIWEASGE